MSEKVNAQIVNGPEETAEDEQRRHNAEIRKQIEERRAEEQRRLKAAMEAMREGKGRLELEKPIVAGDKEIKELVYDFTELTGLDYTEAMDSGIGTGRNLSGLGYRQGLSLFAKAAAI